MRVEGTRDFRWPVLGRCAAERLGHVGSWLLTEYMRELPSPLNSRRCEPVLYSVGCGIRAAGRTGERLDALARPLKQVLYVQWKRVVTGRVQRIGLGGKSWLRPEQCQRRHRRGALIDHTVVQAT